MSIRKKLSYNLLIQAIGPILSFLTIFLIARIGGPKTQGYYASISAWINFAVVVGIFGFPQSFIYLINKMNTSPKILIKGSYFYSILFLLLFIPVIFVLISNNLINSIVISTNIQVFILGVPIAILILHGLLRGIYLTYNQSILFAIFSILPACILFLFVFIGLIFKYLNFQLIYLISSIPLLVIIILMMRPLVNDNKNNDYIKKISWKILFNHGINTFLQALFLASQPIIAYWIINKYIGGTIEIGYFNLGLFLVQGLLVPISMIAPLLFEHWTKNSNYRSIVKINKFKFFILEFILGCLLALSLQYIIPIIFGFEYIKSIRVAQILIIATPIIFHTRILIPAIHSKGHPIINTYTGFLRLILFVIISYTWLKLVDHGLTGLAIAWSLSELIVAVISIILFNKLFKDEYLYIT
ncbi:MAG: hypothetical protein H6Q15_286 [Bacteroidetes bacterium]|nr:hypothetical protein [Bacteroidota bacterium]